MSEPLEFAHRRGVLAAMGAAVIITITYWTLWYAARSSVASESTRAYYDFENAFPAADGWIVFCLIVASVLLWRRRAASVFWVAVGGGAGAYLLCMDVLYDLEHQVWWSTGAGGWIEFGINVLTLTLSTLLLRWAWLHRALLARF